MIPRTRSLTAALVVVLALPGGAYAATSAQDQQSVTADVTPTLEATFPADYAWGALAPGTRTSAEQLLNVKSNDDWGVKVASDVADGRMTEWNPLLGAYVLLSPQTFAAPLQWGFTSLGGSTRTPSYAALSDTAAQIGSTNAATGDSGTDVGLKYQQVVSYADEPAGTGNDYRIEVTFDASQDY